MLKIPFAVLGKPWVLRLLKKKTYQKKNGRSSVAMIHCEDRIMDLGPRGHDIETIRHELVHAYIVELCANTADLTVDALEEIYCELMAKRGRELLDLADALEATVKRLTLSQEEK